MNAKTGSRRVPGVAHHLTQRGVDRRDVFFSDANREVYLRLAALSFERFQVRALAYCLMSNHIHWVVVPPSREALSRAFGFVHGRFAQHMNTALGRSGHFWQNRFFSCALDDAHTWAAVRYVERNPVRAGVVAQAEQWGWSSAGVRFGLAATPVVLDWMGWRERFTPERWRVMLASDTLSAAEDRLRASTYTGRPVGEESFVREAERTLKRTLQRRKGGGHGRLWMRRVGKLCSLQRQPGHNGCAKGGNMRAVPEFPAERWRVMLASDTLSAAEDRLRASTYTGRPVGEESFVREAERTLKRTLQRPKGGRPRKVVDEEGRQAVLFTEAAGP